VLSFQRSAELLVMLGPAAGVPHDESAELFDAIASLSQEIAVLFIEHDIGRALMTNPALLLLDEPLEGLAPIIVEELTAAIRRMRADDGAAFILVDSMPRSLCRSPRRPWCWSPSWDGSGPGTRSGSSGSRVDDTHPCLALELF
jgi:energy-coupling factor transporter ATP-binding protein EcfA2